MVASSLIIFWISMFLVFYIYVGYPLGVLILAKLIGKKIEKKSFLPSLTIIIPVFNEEKHIRATLENKLQLEYPRENIEIIVVSDASTDSTDEIVEKFNPLGVRLVRQKCRQGKTAALNQAVSIAQGEILVFCDGNSLYERRALKQLMKNFADPNVGYATGRMVYENSEGAGVGEGCSSYIRYENWLRGAESNLGSLIGVNGGIDAVRKPLYKAMRPDQQPDFVLPLMVIEQGFRVVYEEDAVLREDSLTRSADEYRMRVRVSLRAMYALKEMKHLMNPLKYGKIAWQLISHKVLRYGAFVPFLSALVSSLVLFNHWNIYGIPVLFQAGFYLSALGGWYLEKKGKKAGGLSTPFYLCLVNLASLHAFVKMLLGHPQIVWQPRTG